ncbi:MAG: hypothetical protein R2883_08260 [Caldisericia bacterium]
MTTSDNDYVGRGVFSLEIAPGINRYTNDYILGANKKRRFAYMETSETNGIEGGSVFPAGTMHVSGGVVWGQGLTGSVGKYKSKTIYTNKLERDIWFGLFWLKCMWILPLLP